MISVLLYTTIPDNLYLSEIIPFVFNSKVHSKTSNFYILDFQSPRQKILYGKQSCRGSYNLNQKLLFYYRQYVAQTRYCHATSQFIDELCAINVDDEF